MTNTRPLLSIPRGGAVLFPVLAAALAACAGPSGSMRKTVNAKIANRDYAGAEASVEGAKLTSYGSKNRVLYHLDLGAVQFDDQKYKESDQNFATAEEDMDELYTKSIHQAAGTLLLNDNTVDYAGERFERAFVNVYRALDYLFQGDRDNALVEIRKLSRLLQEYVDTAGASTSFKDDAFAQYLSGLLYEDGDQPDDARISFEAAGRAYKNYASAYSMAAPRLDAPALADSGDGELVFIHANGVAPRKEGKTFQVAWGEGLASLKASNDEKADEARNAVRAGVLGHAITVAYPIYVQDPFRIKRSEIVVDGRTVPTQMFEDVSAIAQKALAERQALIRTRAVARATIKYILAKAATDAVKKKFGDDSWQGLVAQVGTSALSAATETADTRAWGTLPAQFLLARMPLPPGDHQVTARYLDLSGQVVLTRTYSVTIRKGQRAYLHDRTAL
jgi:tetratricopeptide (TPR) repeat protein